VFFPSLASVSVVFRVFGGLANRLAFSAHDAIYPFLTENVAMWSFFEAGLSKKLSDLDT
jgi:AraC-like DNA-binding protein